MYFYTHSRSGNLSIDVVTKISFGKGTSNIRILHICNKFCKINQNGWCRVVSVQSGSSPPNQKLLPTPLLPQVGNW